MTAEAATRRLSCFVCGKVADETKIDPEKGRCRRECFRHIKFGSAQTNPRSPNYLKRWS